MNSTFFDGLDELYHHAKFEEDRTMCAGCRCENMVFVCFLFVIFCHAPRSEGGVLFVRGVHSSNKHCVAIYRTISMRFSALFQKGLLFQTHYLVLNFVDRWRHRFRKIAVKNFEKYKNRWKSLCALLRIDR